MKLEFFELRNICLTINIQHINRKINKNSSSSTASAVLSCGQGLWVYLGRIRAGTCNICIICVKSEVRVF